MARPLTPRIEISDDGLDREPIARIQPERLVGRGFRQAMTGLLTRSPCPFEFARQEFINAVGIEKAAPLVSGLGCFARAAHRTAGRRIETLPAGCPGFCRDECLAISIVAASQHGSCPALRACAFALLASNRLDETLEAAEEFAVSLKAAGQILSLASVCNATAMLPASSDRPS